MPELAETYACIPSTERSTGILISGDPKSNKILYSNGRSIIILDLSNPLNIAVYGEHAYQATVARFSPNGEWIASTDTSGTVRIWGTHNDHVLKKEFKVLAGRIDDLQWSPDGMRIVAYGDGKGKSLVRAFMWDSGTNVGEFDGHSKRVLRLWASGGGVGGGLLGRLRTSGGGSDVRPRRRVVRREIPGREGEEEGRGGVKEKRKRRSSWQMGNGTRGFATKYET